MSSWEEGKLALHLLLPLPSIGQDLSKGDLADNVLPEESTALLFLCSKFHPGQMILNISPRILFPARVGAMTLYGWLEIHPQPPTLPQMLNKLWQQQNPAGVSDHSRAQRSLQRKQRNQHGGVCTFVCATGTQAADLRGPAVDLLLGPA